MSTNAVWKLIYVLEMAQVGNELLLVPTLLEDTSAHVLKGSEAMDISV